VVLLADKSRKTLVAGATIGVQGELAPVPFGSGIAGKVAASGQAICAAAASGQKTIGEMGAGAERNRRSVLALPLVRDGGVIGVLEVFDKEGNAPFDKGDLETATLLAGLASIAIAENQADEETNELLLRALKLAVEHEAAPEAQAKELHRAVESVGEMTAQLDLLGDQERVVALAGLIREISAHGKRAVEFCMRVLTEFRDMLKERTEG
jgi:GAF domain-containing protein